jgi:hypothetical protein
MTRLTALHEAVRITIEASERRASRLEGQRLLAGEARGLRLHRLGTRETRRLR